MPRVPASPSVQLATARLPTAQNTGIDISPIGQGFLAAARSAQQAADEISSIRLAEADTEFVNRVNDALYRSDDAYFKQVGKQAVDGLIPMDQQLEEMRQSISDQYLDNGRDKRIFANQSSKRLEAVRNRMSVYANSEKDRWDENAALARLSTYVDGVHLDPGADQIDAALPSVEAETIKISMLKGMPEEARNDAVFSAKSSVMLAGVTGALTNDQVKLASQLFDRYGERMTPEDREKAKRALTVALKAGKQKDMQYINELRQRVDGWQWIVDETGQIPEGKNELNAAVMATGDDTTINKWRNATRFDSEVTEFSGQTLDEQRNTLTHMRRNVAKQDPIAGLLVKRLESFHENEQIRAKDDPFRYQLEKFNEQLPRTAQESAAVARRAEEHTKQRTIPMSQEAFHELEGRMASANSQQKMAEIRKIMEFGDDFALRIFGDLDKDLGSGFGVAGALTVEGRGDIAQMVIEGIGRLDRDEGIITNTAFQEELDKQLADAYGGVGTPADGPIREAIAGVYVEMRKGEGEFEDRATGRVDQKTLKIAINMVTGGILEYEDHKVVAPKRGVTQSEFEDWADAISVNDFQSIVHPDPERAYNAWRSRGFLQTVGPGMYAPAQKHPTLGTVSKFKIRTAGTAPDTPPDKLRDLVLIYRPVQ